MNDHSKPLCSETGFPGLEVETSDYVCKRRVRQQILTQAAAVVKTQRHMPMFFAFYPGVAHVYYLIDGETGEFMIERGVEAFIRYTKAHSPYLVAFVAEGVWKEYDPEDPQVHEDMRNPNGIKGGVRTISLTIQSPTEQGYYVHELVTDTDGTLRLGPTICDSDRAAEGGRHGFTAPVDFFNQPPRDLLN